MTPRLEMALIKEDIRSLETGNAFRVEAILGGWQASQIYYWKDRDITKRASYPKDKEDDHMQYSNAGNTRGRKCLVRKASPLALYSCFSTLRKAKFKGKKTTNDVYFMFTWDQLLSVIMDTFSLFYYNHRLRYSQSPLLQWPKAWTSLNCNCTRSQLLAIA